ncbi:MAG: DNA polymerase I [Spirochaetaceae bacterium]|jgi:DNA polymerase-1|nr:DNA polymerase I [Spirochaetaceae bacterium]
MTAENPKPPLYLIDAYGLIYSAYYAFIKKSLRNDGGRNVSVLFEVSRTLVNFLDKGVPQADAAGTLSDKLRKPLRLAAIFDSRTPTFRHKLYAEYKAKRQKTPEDLHDQVPLIEAFLESLGVPALRSDGYEADDIIAVLVQRCKSEGRECYIFSSDKDLLQLVGDGVYELESIKGASGYRLIGPPEVKAKWSVPPDKLLDLLSLMGDSSDNIPGVKGIGEKNAVKLISRYGSLDGIYQNIAGIEGVIGKKLAAGRENAYFSKSLAALNFAVPLIFNGRTEFSIDDLSVERLNRTAGARTLMQEGIREVAKLLDPSVQEIVSADPALLGSGTYKTVTDLRDLELLLEEARTQGCIALDFETDSLDPWHTRPVGISFAVRLKEAVYVPVAPHEGTAPFLDPAQVRSLLASILGDPNMTVIAHNAKFDYEVSRGWGIPRWKCRIWDTMVAAWLSDPERNAYTLDSLVRVCLGYTPTAYRDIVPKGCTFDAVSLETATAYSAEDADLCFRMKRLLELRLKNAETLELFLNLEMPLLPILAEMEGIGIRIEKPVLQSYGIELAKQLDHIQFETYKLVGHEFNLASTKQLQEVLFTERKLKPTKKTKTGYSTDMDVLEELAQEDPAPALILRHRLLSKLKSTYVDGLSDLADAEGRLHTSFIQTGTATGRLSSREPNLQNIPIRDEEGRRIREAFTAKPGHLLISADYSQIELVVLAHLSEDENLIAAFTEGQDVHARTAALIFGVDRQEVNADQRRIAKIINFGVMYGMSAFRLAGELGISRTDAAAFIEAYFKTYSGIRRFIDDLIKKTERLGYASTIFGRRRYIPSINSQNKTEKSAAERVAVNTPIQGSAADIVKTAMLNLDKALIAEQSPARLLLQVHDELILEVPEAAAQAAADLVRREMEHAVSLKVPLRVSVETGPRWGTFH